MIIKCLIIIHFLPLPNGATFRQHLGLTESQTRKEQRIDFHFNSVAIAYNLLARNKTFSLYDIKADYTNQNYLATIITNLDLDRNAITAANR